MTTILDASNLVLKDVHNLLKLERKLNNSFSSLLSLEALSASEQEDLDKICHNFENYYEEGKLLEGEVKFLVLSPLMWLAGFYHPQIRISLEENIAPIQIQDEDILIKGRMDILAVTRPENEVTSLWILLIESKRSQIDALEGLPQLLTYAYTSLEHQDSVWGLTTNGINYQFIYLKKNQSSVYVLLPELNIIRPEKARKLLQILKAVRSQKSGVRSQESGVRSQESGVRSQESGVRSQESGVRSKTKCRLLLAYLDTSSGQDARTTKE